jgi:hypothetical protein
MAFAALDALREGYEVYPSPTRSRHLTGGPPGRPGPRGPCRRQPVSWVSLGGELLRDWGRPEAPAIAEIVGTDRLLKEQ